MSFQHDDGQQSVGGVGFGEYTDVDVAADAKATAIRSVGKFAGLLARAFLLRRAANAGAAGSMSDGFGEAPPVPCPDATPDQAPDETPCARKAAALRAKAAAYRAARREAAAMGR